jgi:hypothetical protein
MRIKVFETTTAREREEMDLFLKSQYITVREVHTAAAGGGGYGYSISHFVTIVYTEEGQAR